MSSWPTGVPETLWNYAALELRALPAIPMMGVDFSSNFLIAFAVGTAFVCYTGWVRFHKSGIDGESAPYRVMQIDIAELGGAAAMRRASIIYTTTLMALYVAVTFFGKLIVQSVNAFNMVGVQVDAASLQFDDPQWPLMLALGFAGLAPMVPWLVSAETWLFRRAYRAVGIPVRIQQTTRNLLGLLNGGNPRARGMHEEIERRRLVLAEETRASWLGADGISRIKRDRALRELAEVGLLAELAGSKRGPWPGASVSHHVRALEAEIVKEAADLRDAFDKTLIAPPPAERREDYLREVGEKASALSDELVAVLAVYVERDPDFSAESGEQSRVGDADLLAVLEEADPPNLAGSGPELGVLVFILVSFPIYAIAIWKGAHNLVDTKWDPEGFAPVMASAGVETLRLLSIFWVPLVAAFGLRQYYCDAGTWVDERKKDPSAYAEQRLAGAALGFCLSAVCLAGVGALAAFFMARDVTAFRANLLDIPVPYILFYPAMAVISLPVVWFALAGADVRAHGFRLKGDAARVNRSGLIWRGVFCGALVAAGQAAHILMMQGSLTCLAPGVFPFNMFAEDCFQRYGGLDYLMMPVLAFLAVVMFGRPHPAPAARKGADQKEENETASCGAETAGRAPVGAAATALFLLWVAAAAIWGSPARAETVTIGFRADAQPFSYRIDDPVAAGAPLYRGFLADLCYWIFDGSGYDVVEKEVTAQKRFESIENREIDVLCDPVTLRYTEKMDDGRSRAEAGIFSPIVFATGVTFLRHRANEAYMETYVAYVKGSTAEGVAERVCEIDLLGVIAPDQRDRLQEMCRKARVARDLPSAGLIEPELLGYVKAAAVDESAFLKRQQDRASAARKKEFDGPIASWKAAEDALEKCGEHCDATLINNLFSADCSPQAPPPPGTWAQTSYRFCPMNTHAEIIKWFCEVRESRPTLVYLGDREIILGKLRTWNEQKPIRCDVLDEAGAIDLSYEPYALMTARPDPKKPEEVQKLGKIAELVQRRVYEFFSFSALARANFDIYFQNARSDRTMSPALAYLFLLNAVEVESRFSNPAPEKEEKPEPEEKQEPDLPAEGLASSPLTAAILASAP